jgi:hypothetical protein
MENLITETEFDYQQTLIDQYHAEQIADLRRQTAQTLAQATSVEEQEWAWNQYDERRFQIQAATDSREHVNIRNRMGPCGAQGTVDWGQVVHCPACES